MVDISLLISFSVAVANVQWKAQGISLVLADVVAERSLHLPSRVASHLFLLTRVTGTINKVICFFSHSIIPPHSKNWTKICFP